MRRPLNELETRWLNLASARLGAEALFVTDDFFASKDNLLRSEPAVFKPDKYTDRGKWMDGWESRRKREPGHDYVVIKLGLAGRIRGFNVDTSHFLGNHPPECSIEACYAPGVTSLDDLEARAWTEVLCRSPLGPGQDNLFTCGHEGVFSHVKLRIYPDGGVARLRVYGRGMSPHDAGRSSTWDDEAIDLASAASGALVIGCNDMFFGPKDNLIMPYPPTGMFDGWETRRRREPGHDWCVVSLGATGIITGVEVDTAYFKGNFPESFALEAALLEERAEATPDDTSWQPLVARTKLGADQLHAFSGETILSSKPVSHVRLNIFPDGGVARLRCYSVIRSSNR